MEINQRFIELFGYEPAEVIGMDVDDVMEMGMKEVSCREFTKSVMSEEKIVAEAIRYNKAGQPIAVFIKGTPIIGDGKFLEGRFM